MSQVSPPAPTKRTPCVVVPAWPWLILGAVVAGCVSLQLDASGDHPTAWVGPGITTDEPLNVAQGVLLADRLFNADLAGFRRVDASLPDYPPLGRVVLGVGHELALMVSPPSGSTAPYSIACARVASAFLFGLTVFLVGRSSHRWWGPWAGLVSAISLVLMPRSFGHAHLASLETAINLAYLACLLAAQRTWESPGLRASTERSGTFPWWTSGLIRPALGTGCALGLAWLIKIQAIFLLPVLGTWAVLWLRRSAPAWLLIVGIVAGALFFAGWPWLWDDPLGNVRLYLGKTTSRATIQAWYEGRAWADRELPWHYPWVLLATTVPLGLQGLGLCGVLSGIRNWRQATAETLCIGGMAVPLLAFSLPGIAVYDGERLFSVVYPLWALLIGRGAVPAVEWLQRRLGSLRLALTVGSCLLLTQAWGAWSTSPAWLSYYNAAVGGLSGAVACGLPPSYWGDGLTRELWEDVARHVPPGSTIALAPTLYESQAGEFQRQTPACQQHQWTLVSRGGPGAERAAYVILINRPEYLPVEDRQLKPSDFVASITRDGVWLAGLKRLTDPPRQP